VASSGLVRPVAAVSVRLFRRRDGGFAHRREVRCGGFALVRGRAVGCSRWRAAERVGWLRYQSGGQCDPVSAGGLGLIECGIGFRDERGAGDPVSWMGGGETDADRQHCLWADSAVFDGEGVQLCADPVQCGGRLRDGLFGQQDEEFLSAVAS